MNRAPEKELEQIKAAKSNLSKQIDRRINEIKSSAQDNSKFLCSTDLILKEKIGRAQTLLSNGRKICTIFHKVDNIGAELKHESQILRQLNLSESYAQIRYFLKKKSLMTTTYK